MLSPEQEERGRVRSMLGGLTRVLGKKKQAPTPALAGSAVPDADEAAAPSVDLDAPLDPKIANRPLEPGSGAPDLNAIMKRVRDERGQPAKAERIRRRQVGLYCRGTSGSPGGRRGNAKSTGARPTSAAR